MMNDNTHQSKNNIIAAIICVCLRIVSQILLVYYHVPSSNAIYGGILYLISDKP